MVEYHRLVMEISASYIRELERQKHRKAALKSELCAALEGVESILFEAGCGHGHWLTRYAEQHAEQTCVGIDLISGRVRKAMQKRDKRELGNLHFFKAELTEFLEVLPDSIRFDKTVMLFPDPWPKARHHRRRMIQSQFLDILAERTELGGWFYFRSDDTSYCEWTVEHLKAHPNWKIDTAAPWLHETETYFQERMESYQSIVAQCI